MNSSEMSRCRWTPLKAIALIATMTVFFWLSQASAYPLHKGEYAFWREMPEAARVAGDMIGRDDLDTAARRHAAFVLLIDLVNMSGDGKGQLPWPAKERELNNAYYKALGDTEGSRKYFAVGPGFNSI